MKKLFLSFLLLIMFLLISALANAVVMSDLYDYTVQILNFDTNLTLDSSIYNNLGSITNTVTYDTGVFKLGTGSALFTAAGYLSFPDIDAYNDGNENYTISFWAKWDATAQGHVWERYEAEANGDFGIQFADDPLLRFITFESNGKNTLACDGTLVNTNVWVLITAVMNRTNGVTYKYLYVNQTQCGYQTHTSTIASTTRPIRYDVFTTGDYAGAKNFYLDGSVYFNKSLTSGEVAFYWNNGDGIILEESSETTPPEMTLINLSSEGGTGQIIYNLSSGTDIKLTNLARTNDTTPTIRATTNITATCALIDWNLDLNYTDTITYNPASECSTTGGLNHICTLTNDNATARTGLHNFSIGCKDGGENLTSTSGKFTINITDPGDTILLKLDGLNQSRKYEYPITRDSTTIPRIVTLTIEKIGSGNACLTIEDQVNISCQTNANWSYYFNITDVKIEFFSTDTRRINLSTGDDNAVFFMDNSTDILEFTVNATGYDSSGWPEDVRIDVDQDGINEVLLAGELRGKNVITNTFLADNAKRTSYNISFSAGGSATINTNTSTVSGISNLTFLISGYELDEQNEFSYTEHFNGSDGYKPFNTTLSAYYDAPLGVFDDFVTNVSGRWNADDAVSCTPSLSYGSDGNDYIYLSDSGGSGGGCGVLYLDYDDAAADLRNTSRIEIDFARIGSCSRSINVDCTSSDYRFYFYATDGTSNVQLDGEYHGQCSANPSSSSVNVIGNYTLVRTSTDYETWTLYLNGSSLGSKDMGALDFTQQIKFRFRPSWSAGVGGGCSASAGVKVYEVKISGGWLNRTDIGTYNSSANITQCIQKTPTDVSRTLIDVVEYKPANTDIEYYLTNEGGNANPTFESTTPGVIHTYATVGDSICVRSVLTSTVNTTSPIVRKMEISVIPGSLENVTIDFGCDGDTDWELLEVLNSSNSPKLVNGSMNDLANYYTNNCVGELTCDYASCITSVTGGTIEIKNVSTVVPVVNMDLNLSKAIRKTTIDMSVKFTNGIVEMSGLDLNFKGHKNYTVNVTLYNGIEKKISHIIQVIYSKFNRTLPYTFTTAIIPYNGLNSVNSTNITPFGQTITTPILNFTGEAKEPFIVGMGFNQTLSCLQSEARNNSNTSLAGINMTTTLSTVLNITSPTASGGIWTWFHLYDCNATALRFIRLKYNEESCCSSCVPCWD